MYPPERSERWAGSFCPSAGSQPVSLPPAAASPACFPGIRRLPSPRTHLLAGTSQANYPSVKWQNEREAHRGKKKSSKSRISPSALLLFCQIPKSFLLKAEECDLVRGRRRQDKGWDCSTPRQEMFSLRQNVGWNVLYAKASCCWDNWEKKTWANPACDRERNTTVAGGLSEFFMNTIFVLKHWIRHRLCFNMAKGIAKFPILSIKAAILI